MSRARRRILALDDQESILDMYKEYADENGAELVGVTSIQEAFEALANGGITEVVVDWNLHPHGHRGGPYTEPVIRRAIAEGLPVTVRTSTDDSTHRLAGLRQELGDFPILDKFAKIGLFGRGPERK